MDSEVIVHVAESTLFPESVNKLYGKMPSTHVINFRISRWGENSGLSKWAQCKQKESYEIKREAGDPKRWCDDVSGGGSFV